MFVIFSPTLSSFPSHSQSKPKPLKWPVRSYVICPPQYFSSFKLTILLSSHTGLSVAPQTQKAHHFLYLERSSHPQIVIRLTTSLPLYLCSNSAFSETSFHGPSKAQLCLITLDYFCVDSLMLDQLSVMILIENWMIDMVMYFLPSELNLNEIIAL